MTDSDSEKSTKSKKKEPFPKPPKRPRTAYAFFVQQNYRQMSIESKARNPKEVLRRLGQRWKELPEMMKRPYKEMQKKDRERYEGEQRQWRQYWNYKPPKRKHRKKEFDAPARTRNSFIFFEQRVWNQVRHQMPEATQVDVVREIARRWRAMTKEEKEPYIEAAMEDKERYAKEKTVFNKRLSEMCLQQRQDLKQLHYENEARARIQYDPERRVIFEPPHLAVDAPHAGNENGLPQHAAAPLQAQAPAQPAPEGDPEQRAVVNPLEPGQVHDPPAVPGPAQAPAPEPVGGQGPIQRPVAVGQPAVVNPVQVVEVQALDPDQGGPDNDNH